MSGYHHTWHLDVVSGELVYRPPAAASGQQVELAARLTEAMTEALAEPTDSLSATVPLPTVQSHGFDWFGTGDSKSQPSS